MEGDGDRWSEAARILMEDFVRPGRNAGVVSAVSVMESLVRPMRRVPPTDQLILEFLAHWPNLTVAPIDASVERERNLSTRVRHQTGPITESAPPSSMAG